MNNLMVIDGIEVRRDVHGRYCLNDLHRAAGGEQKYRPKYWLDNKQTSELVEQLFTEGGIPPSEQNQSVSFFQSGSDTRSLVRAPVNTVRGGAEQGTYVCKELVFAYAMWISPSFHLKVIRTFDMVTSAPEKLSGQAADKMQAGVILLDFMRRELNLSNSSVLGACQKLQEAVGLPNLAPRYAIDAPADAHDGSSRPTLSLSALLKQYGIRLTANQAYHQMVKLGIVEQRERYSRTAINNIKKFWSLTAKGCMFGKNITSPANPRETQPHFFESRFPELLKLLDTVH
ncbi:KilA-N domain-containing protein [Salmonella enterica subsp. enterica serovar Weltevreden]|nr:KilA-N domain-containing protein [Salmonella enterica subsp. enterica serovar Weltevreden]